MKNIPAKIGVFLTVTVLLGGYCFVCPQGVKVVKAAETDQARCEDGVKSRDAAGLAPAEARRVIAHEPAYCPMSHGAGLTVVNEGGSDPRVSRLYPIANPAIVGDLAPRHYPRIKSASLASVVPRQRVHLKLVGTVFKRE